MPYKQKLKLRCAGCRVESFYTTPLVFANHGWTIQDNGEPLCPMCSGWPEQYQRLKAYFRLQDSRENFQSILRRIEGKQKS